MSIIPQGVSLCYAAFNRLRNITSIRKYPSATTTTIFIKEFDNCNSFLFGVPEHGQLRNANVFER